MAKTSGALNARLTISGDAEAERKLERVGDAGERALGRISRAGHSDNFEGIEKGAEGLERTFEHISNLGNLSGLGSVLQGIASSVGSVNVALGATVAVVAAVTAGLFELAEKGAKFGAEIKDGATRVGTSADDYVKLRYALSQAGAGAEDFEKAMGVILEASQQADTGAESVQKAADKIVHNEDRIRAAAEATADAYRTRADTLKESAIRAADDLSEITLRFTRARDAARKLDGDKETEALKKANDDRVEAVRLLNKRLAEEKRLADKAVQQEAEKQQRENAKQRQKDVDDYNKAIAEAATKAEGARKKFQDLGISLRMGDQARDPATIFREVANAIGEIDDAASKSAKAIDLFGRRFGTRLVEALSEGREALKKLEDEAVHLNLIPTKGELDLADKFDDALSQLRQTLTAAVGRIGIALTPLFDPVISAIAEVIGTSIPALIAAAKGLQAVLQPIFDDVANAILGKTNEIKSQFIFVLVRAAQEFAKAVIAAGQVIGLVLQQIGAGFTYVDGIIQSIFGGASIGGILGFLVSMRLIVGVVSLLYSGLVALVAGPLTLLAGALGPIATVMGTIAAAVGWPLILIAGLTALIATLLLAGDGWENFKKGVIATAELVASFIKYLTDPLVAAFNTAADAAKTAWANIYYWASYYAGIIIQNWQVVLGWIKAVADAIAAILGTSSSVAANPQQATPFRQIDVTKNADGGAISGPGTGTSDSILSWLSNGEFVIKARAVRFWGLRAMQALNSMTAPGFAAGGYVDSLAGLMSPASGAGGATMFDGASATQGRVAIDLTHNGTTFRDLLAPAELAARMQRYASSQQRVSLGRRPTAWGAGVA